MAGRANFLTVVLIFSTYTNSSLDSRGGALDSLATPEEEDHYIAV